MTRAWWLLVAVGCPAEETAPLDPADVQVEPVGEAPLPVPVGVRPWRRMDIEQLDASIRQVTDGIGWIDEGGVSQFVALERTLGVPDYIDATIEDLAPSLLFQKFLDDAANRVCRGVVSRERIYGPNERILWHGVELEDTLETNRAGIEQALSKVVHRFHGRTVPVGSAGLEPWVQLFEAASANADTQTAWHTVCVGLFTHPDFYTY